MAINNNRFLKNQIAGRYRQAKRFVYAGGGRCRHCYRDSYDQRALLLEESLLAKTVTTKVMDLMRNSRRNLLEYSYGDKLGKSLSPVADASLCPLQRKQHHFTNNFNQRMIDHWDNGKVSRSKGAKKLGVVLGPYKPGDTFSHSVYLKNNVRAGGNKGRNMMKKSTIKKMATGSKLAGKVIMKMRKKMARKSMKNQMASMKTRRKMAMKMNNKKESKRKEPVIGATIKFNFWAIDIPKKYSGGIFRDAPLIMFINGIKLDFSVLLRAPGVWTRKDKGRKTGRAFAGITWSIRKAGKVKNHGFGRQVDRKYAIAIHLPFILFDNPHTRISTRYFIPPRAKAKRYAVDNVEISALTVPCEIKGLKNSPFEVFKKVTEARLEEKLGLRLAREFHRREGHCLEDKIPVVDVHLIRKPSWKQANPRCS